MLSFAISSKSYPRKFFLYMHLIPSPLPSAFFFQVDRTFMEESQDYVLCSTNTSVPSSFEIIPPHNSKHNKHNKHNREVTSPHGGGGGEEGEDEDSLEIFDDHFSCRSSSTSSSRCSSSCEEEVCILTI